MNRQAVIVDAVRTPVGRSSADRGIYRSTRAEDLAVTCIHAILARQPIDPHEISDIYLGCVQQTREQGANIARMTALLAGLPTTCAGATINRLCGSSLEAVRIAAALIASGSDELLLAGGVEHMHHLPMESSIDLHPQLARFTSRASIRMGITAEFLADRFSIARESQDAYAYESHRRATVASESGLFQGEIVPTKGLDATGKLDFVSRDQPIRSDTTCESLAALSPVFRKGGSVTAGNSSPLSDGASLLLLMSQEQAVARSLQPLARVRASAVIGVEPSLMGLGPVAAARKLLQQQQLSTGDIDRWEMSEAFAVQTLACIDQLQLDPAKVNIYGGGLSIGHPLGASGARMLTTLAHALARDQLSLGIATMCIGMGQGIAILLERTS